MLRANRNAVVHIRDGSTRPLVDPEDFPLILSWIEEMKIGDKIRYSNQVGENWLVE
jgi:hypothetical protein